MIVRREDFEKDPSYYLDIVEEEEIIIVDGEEEFARLTSMRLKPDIADSLKGLLPSRATMVRMREERQKKGGRDF